MNTQESSPDEQTLQRKNSVFPNREKRHLLQFHVLPRIPYGARFVGAAILILIGAGVQLTWTAHSSLRLLLFSAPFLFAGNLLLLIRGYDNEPSSGSSVGTWEKTTLDRFEEIEKLQEAIRSWDENATDISCVAGVFTFIVLGAMTAVAFVFFSKSPVTRFWAPVVAADAIVLLVPHWVTGLRLGWRPEGLKEKTASLRTALSLIEKLDEPPCQIQPMLAIAGKGKKAIPTDARVFIRFPDGPQDFLGVQFQVALNQVKGTNYPYFYGVLVAKKSFALFNHAPCFSALTVEAKKDPEVDVIVIRQKTTKKSGYHTGTRAIRRIVHATWETASDIVLGKR